MHPTPSKFDLSHAIRCVEALRSLPTTWRGRGWLLDFPPFTRELFRRKDASYGVSSLTRGFTITIEQLTEIVSYPSMQEVPVLCNSFTSPHSATVGRSMYRRSAIHYPAVYICATASVPGSMCFMRCFVKRVLETPIPQPPFLPEFIQRRYPHQRCR